MAWWDEEEETLQLSNGSDKPPIVHAILEPSAKSWQYIVVDPSTNRGVIIDPVSSPPDRNGKASSEKAPSDSTEQILRLVRQSGWLIDQIFETESSHRPKLTAAWTLRMQLSEIQGYPPQLCQTSSVSALQSTFQRRYGAKNGFSTTLSNQHHDKEQLLVGRMKVTVMQVPGFRTPNQRAYLINGCLFGAYGIAVPREEHDRWLSEGSDPILSTAKADDKRCILWKSMQRVLALPAETRVYYEEVDEDAGLADCTTIGQCRVLNPYVALTEKEFIVRRRGELQEQQEARVAATDSRKKRSSRQWIGTRSR